MLVPLCAPLVAVETPVVLCKPLKWQDLEDGGAGAISC